VKSRAERDRLVNLNAGLAHKIARDIWRKLPISAQTRHDVDDLAQVGMLELLRIAERFDPERGTTFAGFAFHRIKGAIIDALRDGDHLSRDMRRHRNEIVDAQETLIRSLNRYPSRAEIATKMGIGLEVLVGREVKVVAGATVIGLDDTAIEPRSEQRDAEGDLDAKAMALRLHAEIDALPPRVAHVMQRYYFDGRNLKEIGAEMGVTESRVCQLHRTGIAKIGAKLAL
jgi:RNA polymerase sigma factor for flagellar operon FliA